MMPTKLTTINMMMVVAIIITKAMTIMMRVAMVMILMIDTPAGAADDHDAFL